MDGGDPCYGIIEDDRVFRVRGTPFGTCTRTDEGKDLTATELLMPVFPSTFYAIGSNYRLHVIERAGGQDVTWVKQPAGLLDLEFGSPDPSS